MLMDKEDIERYFSYHEAKNIDPKIFETLREKTKDLALFILNLDSLEDIEKYEAIQCLRTMLFHAISALVIPEKGKC